MVGESCGLFLWMFGPGSGKNSMCMKKSVNFSLIQASL